jgi:hypothetical protein
MESLPYKICTSIPDSYFEPIFFNPNRPMQLPHSVHLEPTSPHDKCDIDDPEMIIIHPQSQLYLDVHEKSRSVPLPPFPDTIQFPTRTAFLDSMIEIYLDPPTGQVHSKMKDMLSGWISYFSLYTLRNDHEYSQMAISNQNIQKCYGVFGQKISRTLSRSHAVDLLAQRGSNMQCAVRHQEKLT